MNPYIRSLIDTIKNNTNGVAFFVNQFVIMLMLFEVIHWSEAQMFGFMSFINAGMAIVVGKTTMATGKVDRRVEEQVAHREMAGTTGTGVGMVPPPSRTQDGTGTGATSSTQGM
jgi:uncharacterized membrane protein